MYRNSHVGIGEYKVSGESGQVIKTLALGSCVAVIVFDKTSKIAGLIHIALPESSINLEKAAKTPGYFVDTGMPVFLNEFSKHGALQTQFWIKIVGGASIMDEQGRFDIGRRNVLAVKKFLWKNRLGIIAEDIGGSSGRSVSISVDSGEVVVSSGGKVWEI